MCLHNGPKENDAQIFFFCFYSLLLGQVQLMLAAAVAEYALRKH